MAMFSVYLDASSDKDKLALSIGAYIATVEQWREFAREWKDLLAEYGIEMMHATDLEASQGQFRGWKKDRKISLQKRVTGIINRRVNIGVAASIPYSDYNAEVTGDHLLVCGSPYNYCFNLVLTQIGAWIDKYRRDQPMQYVFEQGDYGLHECFNALNNQKKRKIDNRKRYLIEGWSSQDKRKMIQLQAADVLAYEQMKHFANRVAFGEVRPQRKMLDALAANGKVISIRQDRESLRTTMAAIDLDDVVLYPEMAAMRAERQKNKNQY